ncbi:MAG: hypothetical protein GXY05_00915, partial [Clostridiales bacterium]|nr:hypothetical protein [Clostridiales bacterium]
MLNDLPKDSSITPKVEQEVNGELLKMTVLAAIGTIADVMPLNGDNRRIVKKGLSLLQQPGVSGLTGLKALIEEAEMYSRTEYDISFKIAPMLNAPGRLFDDGAEQSFTVLAADLLYPGDYALVRSMAHSLIIVNEDRKDAVAKAMDEAVEYIANECLYGTCPLCVCLQDANEGVVGIVAGRLAEEMKTPSFVFTSSETPGVLKGSGRSFGGINLKKILDSAADYLVNFGGHESAAGVTVKSENFYDMVNAMTQSILGTETESQDTLYYDLQIAPDEVPVVNAKMRKYAPFGEGNPSPIFRVDEVGLVPRYGNRYKTMGKDGVHLKLFSNGYSLIRFGGTEDYRKQGFPSRVNVVGTISENKFRNITEVQFEVIDMKSMAADKGGSKLLEALKANGTI